MKKGFTVYKEGDFGFFWVVTLGNRDVKNKIYEGDIDCSRQNLRSLYGAPKEVVGNFNCSANALTSLEDAPVVTGNFNYSRNDIHRGEL